MTMMRNNKKCHCLLRLAYVCKLVSIISCLTQVSEGFSANSLTTRSRFQKIHYSQPASFQRRQQIRHAFFELEKDNVVLSSSSSASSSNKSRSVKYKNMLLKKTLQKKKVAPSPEMGVTEWINVFQQQQQVAKTKTTTTTTTTTTTEQAVGKQDDDKELGRVFLAAFASILLTVGATAYNAFHLSPEVVVDLVQKFIQDPTTSLEAVVGTIHSMGPMGMIFFGGVYIMAEILAIPGFPLVASAGYLFGVVEGTAIVLASASIAASVSFWIGRTALRSYVEDLILKDRPDLRKIDRAIERQGFKLMLLLRLSPIFPFALSNYVYGASSVAFGEYFWGTILGFLPGTLGYVYAGVVGKALTLGGDNVQPWYVYAGGLVLLSGMLKIMADVATEIVNEIEEQDDDDDNDEGENVVQI